MFLIPKWASLGIILKVSNFKIFFCFFLQKETVTNISFFLFYRSSLVFTCFAGMFQENTLQVFKRYFQNKKKPFRFREIRVSFVTNETLTFFIIFFNEMFI